MTKLKKFLSFILVICVTLSLFGCTNTLVDQERFEQLIYELFIADVSDNTITLHYTLSNPSAYGLGDLAPTIYDLTVVDTAQQEEEIDNTLDQLHSIRYDNLTSKQQLTYDIVEYYLELNRCSIGFEYLYTYFDSISGLPSNMPINMAEYAFNCEKDVTDYIALLKQFPQLFNQAIEHEKQRVERGLGLNDNALNTAISQCNDFVSDTKNNYLQISFVDKINAMELSQAKKNDYIEQNNNAFINYVVPAYRHTAVQLSNFVGKSTYSGGLCNYPQGKEYYEFLTKLYSGSNMPMSEIIAFNENNTKQILMSLITLARKNFDAYTYYYDQGLEYSTQDPITILNMLNDACAKEYPLLPVNTYSVKKIQESLQDVLSPAFYMLPPIDDYQDNTIYINEGKIDKNTLWSTLAHEGFPGHLYQNIYFASSNPHEIRKLMSFDGYSEGWAVYSERKSYEMYTYPQYNDELTELSQIMQDLNLSICSRVDIGVNYQGWSVDEITQYLEGFGLNSSMAQEIYDSVISSPANYHKYYLGYCELIRLQNKAKSSLGVKYKDYDFHVAYLDVGPAPFCIVEEAIDDYIDAKLK